MDKVLLYGIVLGCFLLVDAMPTTMPDEMSPGLPPGPVKTRKDAEVSNQFYMRH